MPKGRYRVMRAYLPQHGRLAHEMMKRTATVQANLDYLDEADAMEKLRLGLGLSSLVTALFAASPLVDGKVSGYQSYRAACWLECDDDRCGLLPFAFKEGAGFRSYVEWALDVPMFFVYRAGEYRALGERLTFRRFLAEGLNGEHATQADWELHLSTLFPETRLKRYVEVRQADAGSRAMARALPVLWRGLLYDEQSRHAAWALVRDWSFDERLDLYRRTPRKSRLRAKVAQHLAARRCASSWWRSRSKGWCGSAPTAGAGDVGPARGGRSQRPRQADRIVELYAQHDGDPARLIPALALT